MTLKSGNQNRLIKSSDGKKKGVTPHKFAALVRKFVDEIPDAVTKSFLQEVEVTGLDDVTSNTGRIVNFGSPKTFSGLKESVFDECGLLCSCGSSFIRCEFSDWKKHAKSCNGAFGEVYSLHRAGDSNQVVTFWGFFKECPFLVVTF